MLPVIEAVVLVILAVPIANPIRWRLIENRAMLLLDVRLVQTDLPQRGGAWGQFP
jgi:hypothetical protein